MKTILAFISIIHSVALNNRQFLTENILNQIQITILVTCSKLIYNLEDESLKVDQNVNFYEAYYLIYAIILCHKIYILTSSYTNFHIHTEIKRPIFVFRY